MKVLKRVLLATAISWGYSVTLGLLFAACAFGSFSLRALLLPAVIPVALILSTEASILIMPIAIWAVRTGTRNLLIYGPILWIILAAYIILIMRHSGVRGPYGLLLVAALGTAVLGFIPNRGKAGG